MNSFSSDLRLPPSAGGNNVDDQFADGLPLGLTKRIDMIKSLMYKGIEAEQGTVHESAAPPPPQDS